MPEVEPFVAGPKEIFPFSKTSTSMEVLHDEVTHSANNIGYDSRYVPGTGILSSATFAEHFSHTSYMILDSSKSELKAFTFLVWVYPTLSGRKTLFVSKPNLLFLITHILNTYFLKQKAKHNDNEFVIEVAIQWWGVKITPAGESTEELKSFGKSID